MSEPKRMIFFAHMYPRGLEGYLRYYWVHGASGD